MGEEAPRPKSPPRYPDMCGRRRLQLEVQILNRELGFLEQEIQGLERVQPVSRCCKDVNEFVGAKTDPLIPVSKVCTCLSCLCCWSSCLPKPRTPCCCPSCSCLNTPPRSEDNCSCCCCLPGCDCKPRYGHCRPQCGSCSGSPCAGSAGCLAALRRCLSCRPSCCNKRQLSCCGRAPTAPPCPECSCGCVCSCHGCKGGCWCPPCVRNPCCAGGCLC